MENLKGWGVGYNPEIRHRRSIRLKDYDYSQEGAYFVTICTHNRVFVQPNRKCGNIVKRCRGNGEKMVVGNTKEISIL